MKPIRTLLLLALAALMTIFAGCARERTGPFDVPKAVPSPVRTETVDDGLAKAAAEIAASEIFFDFDKAAIRPDAAEPLHRVAALLKRYPSIGISIHGHCDERGGKNYNYDLGARRARAVYGQLLALGMDPAQVDMVTYGKDEPAVGGRTESAYARNRRVEFTVTTTCR